jgi:hypothetical protein
MILDLEACLSLLASTNQKNVLSLVAFGESLVELKANLGLLISTNKIRVTHIASVKFGSSNLCLVCT